MRKAPGKKPPQPEQQRAEAARPGIASVKCTAAADCSASEPKASIRRRERRPPRPCPQARVSRRTTDRPCRSPGASAATDGAAPGGGKVPPHAPVRHDARVQPEVGPAADVQVLDADLDGVCTGSKAERLSKDPERSVGPLTGRGRGRTRRYGRPVMRCHVTVYDQGAPNASSKNLMTGLPLPAGVGAPLGALTPPEIRAAARD